MVLIVPLSFDIEKSLRLSFNSAIPGVLGETFPLILEFRICFSDFH